MCVSISTVVNEDYFPTILPDTGFLTSFNSIMCHSMIVRDDDQVEPPETFTVSINATGPSQEFIDLFNITVPETAVRIVDNDSEKLYTLHDYDHSHELYYYKYKNHFMK